MSRKKILSVIASTAIIATGLSAFEMNPSGNDQNIIPLANGTNGSVVGYLGGKEVNVSDDNHSGAVLSDSNAVDDKGVGLLSLSKDLRGDALIYPFYKHTGGWGTEITVRNTTPHATVAKAVVYRNDNSIEMVDFNIYLSPFDSATFTIKDNKIVTTDASFAKLVSRPNDTLRDSSFKDIAQMVRQKTADSITQYKVEEEHIIAEGWVNGSNQQLPFSDKGYVVIYGMTQYNDNDNVERIVEKELNYHKDHVSLLLDYRKLLDECRPPWRTGYINSKNFKSGTFYIPIQAPNVDPGCGGDNKGVIGRNGQQNNLGNFTDVISTTLTGTVRVYKAEDAQSRDLILPATPLANFTSEQMMLWTEGEWASIADRRLLADNSSSGKSGYDKKLVQEDAKNAFFTKSAYFTFRKDSSSNDNKVVNKLIVTQPMKKVLLDLLTIDEKLDTKGDYWTNFEDGQTRDKPCLSTPDVDREGYYGEFEGGFVVDSKVFDTDEHLPGDIELSQTLIPITSPYTPPPPPPGLSINCEVAELGDEFFQRYTEVIEADSEFEYNKDGFAYVKFTVEKGSNTGLPAIVTQMSGSKVGGVAQTNWIYAPTIK